MPYPLSQLIQLLQQLPSDTRILVAEGDGIHDFELGNLCPFKALKNKFGTFLYIDDGSEDHGKISQQWMPIDEFLEAEKESEPEL